jgi:class 3 adenylate cyclase
MREEQTIVMTEGRRMMRLSDELGSKVLGMLLDEYQRLVREVLERGGGQVIEAAFDTVVAAFPASKQAALASADAQRAVAEHAWPHERKPAISVGLDAAQRGVDRDAATARCAELCDAAEGGQIFLSPAVGRRLEGDDLGGLLLRDLGDVPLRRTERRVRAYELVVPQREAGD